MSKKLLVLAIASAFVAPAAMADVTISGTINMGPQYASGTNPTAAGQSNSVVTSAGGQGWSTLGFTSNYSNVNLNSTEDIGDGNKVVFNAQLDFSNTGSTVHDTSGALRQRNTFLGFEGGWGSLRMGINEQIYERYMYQSDVFDGAAGIGGNLQMLGSPGYGVVFDNGNGSCAQNAGCAGFYRRSGNSIWYDSPDINGFTFGIAQGLNAYQSSAGGAKPTFTSMGVQYKPADLPFFVNAAYERHKDFFGLNVITGTAGASGSTDTGMQLGGGLMFGDMSLFARYEQLKYKSDGLATGNINEYKRDATWFGFKYNVSTGAIVAQFGIANDGKCQIAGGAACNANDSGSTQYALGYQHNLSKQTQLLFYGTLVNNDPLARYVIAGVGTPTNAARTNTGGDVRSIAILVKHSF
ncbi:MAG: porin [Betaproteobacteria bacterium]|nr:porin [Betaproteobacteria bacterium]